MSTRNRFIDTGGSDQKVLEQTAGEDVTYFWDFSREATRRDTALSTVTTECLTLNASIANQLITDLGAQFTVSSKLLGQSIIKTTALFSNGTRRVKTMRINIVSPYGEFEAQPSYR